MPRMFSRVAPARARVSAEAHADASVVNSVAETNMASLAIPTTAAAGDVLHFVFAGDLLNNSAGAVTFMFRAKIGATTVITSNALSLAASASRHRWSLEGEILVVAPGPSSPDQRLVAEKLVAGAGGANLQIASSSTSGVAYGTAAEDLSAGRNLVYTVTLGTADALADCYCHLAVLEIVKK